FAGPLEAEEYFTLPDSLRSPRAVEITRFAILPEYRQGKTFLPSVSMGLFRLAVSFLRARDVDAAVIWSQPAAAWPYEWLRLTRLAAEDARHAHALLGRMEALDVPCLRVPSKLDPLDAVLSRCRTRDVKQVYQERSLLSEAALMEVTVAVIVGKAQFVQTL